MRACFTGVLQCARTLVAVAGCAALALAQGASEEPSFDSVDRIARPADAPREVVLVGFVLDPDGNSAEGVLVSSSAGGRATTDHRGNYRLVLEVPPGVTSVQVTARGGAGRNLSASTSVTLLGATSPTRLDPLQLVHGSPCAPTWVPTFGAQPGMDLSVYELAVFDDGSGPALYAGGSFTVAGSTAASKIAEWDGSSWAGLGTGMPTDVRALTTYDDGNGPALYAGGFFSTAGGVPASRIAKWDGSSWSALGSGMSGAVAHVLALASYDDGNGAALYAGGAFTIAGGMLVSRIARWNGSSWSALGTGMNLDVLAFAVYDDGSGPALYAGGAFTTAGGVAASRIARWNGSTWSPLGSGLNGGVQVLTVYDDGSGPALYAGGSFANAGGVAANRIAKWDGTSWSALASGLLDTVTALTVHDDGSGPALYAGGHFASPAWQRRIARWDGASWSPVGRGLDSNVRALAFHDDGGGSALYAGGEFTVVGGVAANRIAKWDGASWSALAGGMNGAAHALVAHDDGDGPALYAGGVFTTAGGVPANRIAKWDGSNWSALGSGMSSAVRALLVYDDGGGPALYAGGDFGTAGGVTANCVAKWDGSSWSALSTGMNGAVLALAVHDDGGGPALYAGGSFTTAGGVGASRVAKWDGSSWSSLAIGLLDGAVRALAVYDDSGGPALYAGGDFTYAGGAPPMQIHGIAKWDGTRWWGFGSIDEVHSLVAFNDGRGAALFAGGDFTSAGGVAANRIVRRRGGTWFALDGGMNDGVVFALAGRLDGDGPALYAGGVFPRAIDSGDSFLARWGGCLDTIPPVLSCPSSVTTGVSLSGGTGSVVNFTVTATDDLDATPVVVCVPPSGSFFPLGTTLVQCTATDASGNQDTCQFPVTVTFKVGQRGF